MPPNHLILYRPLLLLPSIFPSIRVFSSESAVRIKSNETSASSSVFPINIQDSFTLWLTGLISLQSKRLSRVFSSTTIWKHQFFGTLPSLWSETYNWQWKFVITCAVHPAEEVYRKATVANWCPTYGLWVCPQLFHILLLSVSTCELSLGLQITPRHWSELAVPWHSMFHPSSHSWHHPGCVQAKPGWYGIPKASFFATRQDNLWHALLCSELRWA